MILITPTLIKACVPAISESNLKLYADHLQIVCIHFNINNLHRIAMFFAQVGHECRNFSRMEENLNYSAERLLEIFPKYFTKETAAQYAHKPAAIASRVYANRMGNGPEASLDGWRHRGKGAIMVTGKYNQNLCAVAGKFSVESLTNPYEAIYAAGWFWNVNKLNALADKGTMEAFEDMSIVINGGRIGLEDRKKRLAVAYKGLKDIKA